jgi:hypothetical protein
LDFLKQKLLLVHKVIKEWSEAKGAADHIEGGKPTSFVINHHIKWLLRLINGVIRSLVMIVLQIAKSIGQNV